jgi:hypothetical protein
MASNELQLLPTLLHYCHAEQYVPEGKRKQDDGMDYATITVFSCRDGCRQNAAGCIFEELFLFVEPAPMMDEEMSSGKLSLREYFAQPSDPALS